MVEFAVDGRAYVDARGCSLAEAAQEAEGNFCDVDLGELECVDFKVAKGYDEDDEICDDYDVVNGDWYTPAEDQDYIVGFEVDARAHVSVRAVDTVRAVEEACREIYMVDFGELECIKWKAVKVTDAKGKLYDDERDLFGAAQAGVDRLIAGAERQRSGVNKGHGARSAEDLERV